jgi:hypothetical protein
LTYPHDKDATFRWVGELENWDKLHCAQHCQALPAGSTACCLFGNPAEKADILVYPAGDQTANIAFATRKTWRFLRKARHFCALAPKAWVLGKSL